MRYSPSIIDISWGTITIEGFGKFKDAKLFPGGAREWDWNDTSTRHSPGVQIADVKELVDLDVEEIILGIGFNQRLAVTEDLVSFLQDQSIELHIRQSEIAAKLYNDLRKLRAIGALIHSTC